MVRAVYNPQSAVYGLLATGFLTLFVLALLAACRSNPVQANDADPGHPVGESSLEKVRATFVSVSGRTSSFTLEKADTSEKRARGLMFRKELAHDRGMLFVFPREEVQTFHMKNTYLPLDMIFIGSDGQVKGVVENARPMTLQTRSIGRPSRYVVELMAYTARKKGIGPGAKVRFKPSVD